MQSKSERKDKRVVPFVSQGNQERKCFLSEEHKTQRHPQPEIVITSWSSTEQHGYKKHAIQNVEEREGQAYPTKAALSSRFVELTQRKGHKLTDHAGTKSH